MAGAANRPLVRIYDANRFDLRGRISQLRAAGISDQWRLEATTSRNALLHCLDADVRFSPRQQSVVLLDCRTESGDLEQVGFRVLETIRRHEHLWKATRPVIWVDELTVANEQYARALGADALLDDDWLDESDGAGLSEVLEWAANRAPAQFGRTGDPETFTAAEPDPAAENALRDERFQRWFGFPPDDLDYILLWGLAGAVELGFLYSYCAEHFEATERSARRASERLQNAMRREREHLDRAESWNAEIARRFLAEAAPAEPDPLAELAWPSPSHIRELLRAREDIVRFAFLEPDAQRHVQAFVDALPTDVTKVTARHETVMRALAEVAKSTGEPLAAIHAEVQRSCHALDDAYTDWRTHGNPD